MQNSYTTVSAEEEARKPLDDTLSAKGAATQLKTFKWEQQTRPFFLGLGFRKLLRHACTVWCFELTLTLTFS